MKCVLQDKIGVHPFMEPDPEDADTRVRAERDSPLQFYCDYEATMDDEGVQTAILLCAESDKSSLMVQTAQRSFFNGWNRWLLIKTRTIGT